MADLANNTCSAGDKVRSETDEKAQEKHGQGMQRSFHRKAALAVL